MSKSFPQASSSFVNTGLFLSVGSARRFDPPGKTSQHKSKGEVINRSKSVEPGILFFALAVLIGLSGCEKKEDSVGPGTGREGLSDPSIKPSVVYTMPPNGSVGPFRVFNWATGWSDPHFVVQFNKYINLASIKEWTITCSGFPYPVRVFPKDYYYYYRGASLPKSAGPFKELIEFTIVRSTGGGSLNYELGSMYTITIDSTLEDINGNRLGSPFSFSFIPEPSFRSLGTSPPDGSRDIIIDNYNTISVFFNSPVTGAIISKVRLAPSVSGTWNLATYDSTSIVFNKSPQESWGFGKTIETIVDAGGTDSRGNVMTAEYRSRFSTAPFKVQYTNPQQGGTMYDLFNGVYLEFTGYLDTATIQPSVTVSPALTGPVNFDTYSQTRTISFRPVLGFRGNRTYTVTVGTSLKAFDGTPLPSPFVLTFSTPPFRIQFTYPANNDSSAYRYNGIQISTNSLIDPSRVPSAISAVPSLPAQYSWYVSGRDCNWNGTLAANTTYTITLSTAFRSLAGDTLLAPYQFTFRTGQ